ncbi:permease prefix domain 1-containing protein [Enteractinococcus fodinae]|uniref:Membrane protein n=1 Tax=Enteractinococcus fodinae TaxID=684663 RepID=A0ABU2AZ50_9MICC|nr:permease prefix domain 1-containing protein [Enteractinococcus fodinae]MDR7346054.1 putative membrane protein [Enteractinococcus fodinae]
MTTSLTQRYIAATIEGLPEKLRSEVRPELEASIADAVDARMTDGVDHDTAEREVLTELGDPAVLAAGYADRPLQLIGPRYYPAWSRLLKRLLVLIMPLVFVLVAFAQVIASGDIGTVIAEAIVATMSTGLHICFWVTLSFAIIERTGADLGMEWSLEDLPEPREDRPGAGDLIASLVFIGIVLVALIWDQTVGFIRIFDERVTVLNPELWPWTMAGFLALLALDVIFAVALYRRGGWNVPMAVLNTALSVLIFSWFIILLARGELFSADLLRLAVDNGIRADAQHTLAVVFGFGVGLVAVWDIIDGWVKTYRANSAGVEQQPAAT